MSKPSSGYDGGWGALLFIGLPLAIMVLWFWLDGGFERERRANAHRASWSNELYYGPDARSKGR